MNETNGIATDKNILLFACVLLVILIGCGRKNDVEDRENAVANKDFPDYKYDQERMQRLTSSSHAAVFETGYYYIINDTLYYFDVGNFLNMPMCSKVDCKHDSKDCDAFVTTVNPENADLSCNCLSYKVFTYEGSLFFMERTNSDFILYKTDSSFNHIEKMSVLASLKEKKIVSTGDAAIISNGYLYYISSAYDEKYAERDYMQTFQCMRVSLDKNATPEIIGEFDFPGDYAMAAGDSNGFRILCHGHMIYYVAGGVGRWNTTTNPVQYRLMAYDTLTKEFKIHLSYTGDNCKDIWGEGTGNAVEVHDNVCIDDEGNIYVLTCEDTQEVNVVQLDPRTGQAAIIYTTQYDKIQQLLCDGRYLFFIEGNKEGNEVEKSFVTAIDTTGAVVNRKELEYADEYLDFLKIYKDRFPASQVIKPSATAGNVEIYITDDRFIMVVARGDVFKNLTSTDIFKLYVSDGFFHESVTVGVGVINKSSFLSDEECEIIQIYKHQG